jgi:hypothetical protein
MTMPGTSMFQNTLSDLQSRSPYRCALSTGNNLTILLERGYEIETKSGNAALVQALLGRVTLETEWTRVGKNAEMLGWTGYQLSSCPYPLTVGLERFHTPGGDKHEVLLRYQSDPHCQRARIQLDAVTEGADAHDQLPGALRRSAAEAAVA